MKTHRPLPLLAVVAVLSLPAALLAPAPSGPRQSSDAPAHVASARASVQPAGAPDGVAASRTAASPTPARYAYYYIWFSRSSWRRAKSDRPLLGAYDSGDVDVMRQHVRWAKSAGIDGFIVSWKHTPVLDERLTALVDVAEEEHFSLAIIYQGLDFHRNPLPATEIGAGLHWFDQHLSSRAPFRSCDV